MIVLPEPTACVFFLAFCFAPRLALHRRIYHSFPVRLHRTGFNGWASTELSRVRFGSTGARGWGHGEGGSWAYPIYLERVGGEVEVTFAHFVQFSMRPLFAFVFRVSVWGVHILHLVVEGIERF